MDMDVRRITLGPSLADTMLANPSPRQRKIAWPTVAKMAAAMNAGLWPRIHPVPIQLDEEGRLLNGGHRCSAHIEASHVSDYFLVAGVPEEGFVWMDNNRPRKAEQFVQGKLPSVRAGIITQLMMLELTDDSLDNLRDARRIVNEPMAMGEKLAQMEQHPMLEEAATLAQMAYNSTRIRPSLHGALLLRALEAGLSAEAKEWAHGLASGIGLRSGDPRLTLRERWIREPERLNGTDEGSHKLAWAVLVRAWNAYMADEYWPRAVVRTSPMPRQLLRHTHHR